MDTAGDLKVKLTDLPTQRHLELPSAFVRDAIAGLALYTALERPADDPDAGQASAHLHLYTEGGNVFARGRVRGWLAAACSRCIGTVRVPVDEDISVTYMPRHQMPDDADIAGAGDVGLTEDDLDLFPYDGEEIDLAPLLREQLVLAVPFAPLCAEDCKGLCPQCGADLNQTTCSCDRTPVDPRLAALKDIKL
jgi:DUF177 domain-containing protein